MSIVHCAVCAERIDSDFDLECFVGGEAFCKEHRLLPCPFCGAPAYVECDRIKKGATDSYCEVGCTAKCEAHIHSITVRDEIIKRWNTRSLNTNNPVMGFLEGKMPWLPAPEDESQPARYGWPAVLPDCVVLGHPHIIEYARQQRKDVVLIRESLIATQKAIGREDREGARYLADMASDLLKQYRGWDAAIGIIEGKEGYHDWRKQKIQKEIAPFVDRAFHFMELAA